MKASSIRPARKHTNKRDKTRPGMHVEALEARIAPAATVTLTGTLANDVDGDGVADPGDRIHYSAVLNNASPSTPITLLSLTELINDPNLIFVPGSLNVSPLASDDTFTAQSNTQLRVGSPAALSGPFASVAGSLTGNDFEFLGDSFVLSAFDATSAQGGTVSVSADGSFSYVPAAGFLGTDTFTYTLRDDGIDGTAGNADDLTSVGTVTITVQDANGATAGAPEIWYVDASYAGGNGASDGRSHRPFTSLAQVTGATGPDAAGDIIYVRSGSYAQTMTLLGSQTLQGENTALVINGFTLQAQGTAPTIAPGTGTALTLGSGNTLTGFTIGDSAIDIAGSAFGTLTVSNVTLNGTGKILDLTNGTVAGTGFNSVSTTSTAGLGGNAHGLKLDNVSGTVNLGSTTISGTIIQGIYVFSSDATINFGNTTVGSPSQTTGVEAIRLEANDGGSRNFGTLAVTASQVGGIGMTISDTAGSVTTSGLATFNNITGDALSVFGAANISFNSLTLGNTGNIGGSGIVLNSHTGTFNTGTGGTIANVAGTDVSITGGTGAVTITEAITNASGAFITIDNHETGNVTFSGNLTSTAAGVSGISVTNSNSGTITFSGGTKTLTTTTNPAVSLTNNNGSTISFTGGGLAITTTTGAGFTATNTTAGGNINVTGSGNTISTGTGRVVNWDGVNVGDSGVTFASLTATGTVANTAILLNNVDAQSAGNTFNGGTVSVNSTSGATSDGVAITGDSAATFSFGSTTVSNTGRDGIRLNGANGPVTFSSVTISGTAEQGVGITGATSAVTISGGSIGQGAGNGLLISGGGAAIDIAATINKTASNNVVFITARTGGTVNLTGNITTSAGGVAVNTNTGGTVNLTGPTISGTAATSGLQFTGNNASTTLNINPAGGGNGFDLSTSTGTAFLATGAGTITVQGGGNSLATTTGTALNVNGVSIGSANLNFVRIDSNGASSGIILNNTGASGGLIVTGDGTAANNGSGGTIQNSTGDGISLTNTQNVRLTQMNITNNLGDGIGGSGINGFLLTRLNISGNGNDAASDESGINVAEVTGSAFGGARPTGIINSVISNNNEFEVQITNTTGTLTDFQLTTNTISSNGQPINGNATSPHGNLVNFLALGTANMTLNATGGTYSGNITDPPVGGNSITATAIQADHSGTSGLMTANISGVSFSNNNVAVSVSASNGGGIDFDVNGNTATANRSHGLNLFVAANSTGIVTGSFTNNVVGTMGVDDSGSRVGIGIRVQMEAVATANPVTVLISGNTVQEIENFQGININQGISGQASTRTVNATIINNTIRQIDNSRAIAVQQNNNTNATSAGITNLDVRGNVLDLATIAGQAGDGSTMRFRQLDANGGDMNIVQAAPTTSAIAGELDDANGFNEPGDTEPSPILEISLSGSIDFNQAAPPLPLLFAPTFEAPVTPPVDTPPVETVNPPVMVAPPVVVPPVVNEPPVGEEPPTVPPPVVIQPPVAQQPVIIDDGILSQAELDSLVEAAIARWAATGLSAEQVAILRSVVFTVEDLGGWQLGEAGDGVVTLDANAAGNAWFIDATPMDDVEFAGTGTQLFATATGGAKTRVDALTTLMHELGHQLGLEDSTLNTDAQDLMYGYLTQSERRLPAFGQAEGADAHDLSHAHAALTFAPDAAPTLGGVSLPVGKSITIVYDGTIANLTHGIAPTVQTQIQVTHAGGTLNSNIISNAVDGMALGNFIFRDNNRNGTFDAGDAGIDGVAVSLFVDADNDNVADTPSTPLATATTAGGGFYAFLNLLPGNYLVRADQSNFNTGGALLTLPLASPNGGDPDNNIDNDSNGTIVSGNGALSQSITLAYNTEPTAGTGNDTNFTLDFGFMTLQADLAITKTDGAATEIPGTTVTYTITASNAGPNGVVGATVADTFAGILSSVTWTAVAAGGASGTLSGSGDINQTVDLPSGASLTYTVTGTISPTATGSLVNTATITAPATVTDPNTANNSATDTDTLVPTGDLSITKTDGATTEVPGTPVTYTIVVANSGPSTATGATVADTFAGILSSVTWTAVAAGGATGTLSGSGNLNESVTLPSGASLTYTVTGTIASTATGSLVNTATVTAPGGFTDSTPGNNSATDTDTLTPEADLSITKTNGSTTEVPGTTTTYTIVVANNGPSFVTGATVADTFPGTLTGVTWTAVFAGSGSSGTTSGSGNLSELINLASGGTATYTVTGTIAANATGTLVNTSTVTAPGGVTDTNAANNSATDTDTLTPQADLAITKTDGVTTAVPGGSVTYTITVSNAGPSSVTGAMVADTFPGILTATWTSAGAGGGTATGSGSGSINDLVNLPVGGSVTYTVTASISASATGTLSNTATVTAPGGVTDTNAANNSATDTDTLTPQADLAITKTDGVTTAVPGQAVTYTITVSNSGLSNAPGAIVADTFPASLSSVTWTSVGAGGGTGTASGSGNINDTVNLPAGGSVTYTVSGIIDAGATGSLSNTATITAPGGVTDPVPGNNSATDTDTLTPQADLQITKTDGLTEVPPGPLTYTVVVSNAGPSHVFAARIQDTFPANFTGVTWTAVGAGGATGFSTSGSGNIDDVENFIPSGATITYTITGTVPAGATGILTNTATVSDLGGATDPTPGNNSATDNTQIVSDDLSITKTDNSETAVPGTTVTYTIVVRNSQFSLIAANGATVADTFAASLSNLTLVSVVGTNGATSPLTPGAIPNNFTDTANLPIDSTLTYTITGLVNAAATGTLSNTATITAPVGFNEAVTANNSATDESTLAGQFDLAITKSDSPDPVIAGQNVTYTINLTKSGPSDAGSVVISDILPAGLTFVSAMTPAGWDISAPAVGSNGTITFTKQATMTNGETPVFTIVAMVAANVADESTIANTASVSSSGTDTNDTNDDATALTTVDAVANVVVTKSDSPDPATAGTNVTFTINVSNTGSSDAQNVSLTDMLPAGMTFVSLSAPGGWSATTPAVGGTGTINASIPTLAAGASAMFTLVANVDSNVVSGTIISNTATGSTTTSETTAEDNAASSTTTVNTVADLSVVKSGTEDANAGENITYTINLTNNGPSDALSVNLNDALPAGTTFVSLTTPGGWSATTPAVGGTGSIFASIPSLAPGASAIFTLVLNVNSSVTDGTVLSNTASATTTTTDANAANDSDTALTNIDRLVDLVVTKTDAPDPVNAGADVTYTITITNSGPSDAANVSLLDTLPAGMTFRSIVLPDGSWSGTTPAVGSGGAINGSTAALAAGASAVFTVVARVDSNVALGTIIENTATAGTDSEDANPGNNSATSSTTVTTQTDLVVTKDAPDAVAPGTDITYTITLGNTGPSDAQSVVLSDILPAGTTFVSVSQTSGPVFNIAAPAVGSGGTVLFDVASFATNATATFTLVVNSGSIAAGTNVSNTATVTTVTTEPDTEDNTSTDTTLIGGVDLVVTKENNGNDDVVVPGETITYTINYANNGFQDANGVVLTETLPAGTTFIATGSTAGWTQVGNTNQYTLNLGTLDGANAGEGESGTAIFIVGVVGSAPAGLNSIENTTTIAYDGAQGADTNSEDNTATDSDTLNAAPDLTITKTNPLVSVPRGYLLEYTLNYGNAGNQNATGVILRETLPAGTTFNAAASSEGWTLAEDASGDYVLVIGNVNAAATGTATFAVTVNQFGPDQINNTATIDDDNTNGTEPETEDNTASLSKPIYKGIYVVSTGKKLPGERASVVEPRVRVYDVATGTEVLDFLAYEATSKSGVFTAVGDFDNDGFDDIVTSIGKGTGRVRLWNGLTGDRMNIGTQTEINAFAKTGRGGVVAVGDITGDGTPDIFISDGYKGTTVKAFNGDNASLLRSFKPFGNTAVGVHIATGDFDGDGRDDLVTARSDGKRVRVFSGLNFDSAVTPTRLLDLTLPAGKAFEIDAADVNGDGRDDLIFGSGPKRAAEVSIYSTITNSVGTPIAIGVADSRVGVSIAGVSVDLDGVAEIIVAGGPKRGGSLRFFESTGTELTDLDFLPFPERPTAPLFVSGSKSRTPVLPP